MALHESVVIDNDLTTLRSRLDSARAQGLRVGFVPTMGALHQGHLALAKHARDRVGPSGITVVSIFVNPTQFGPNEDLARYPRELEADAARCAGAGVDVVFAPSVEQMYPAGDQTRVRLGSLAEPLCGPLRPGHFEGVATVVSKLFVCVGACVAVFGRKDYQQLKIIERLARDLLFPVEVVGIPTVREADGLAMSSRNRYLSSVDRVRAAEIPRALSHAVREWENGERDVPAIRARVEASLRNTVDRVEYVEARDADTLASWEPTQTKVLIALAVRVGTTRLIDNVVLGVDRSPVQ